MKKISFICYCLLVWVPSCRHKGADYYKETYQKNKQRFLYIQNNLQPLLIDNDSVFKIHFEVTGKRTFATFYENDSTFANDIPIPKNVEFSPSVGVLTNRNTESLVRTPTTGEKKINIHINLQT